MPAAPLVQVRPELVDGVAVIDLLPREITDPEEATRLGVALRAAFDARAATTKLMILNFAANHYLSSSVFAVLLRFGIRAASAGGKVAIANMDPFVRTAADIVRLGRIVPIFDDEPSAVSSLTA